MFGLIIFPLIASIFLFFVFFLDMINDKIEVENMVKFEKKMKKIFDK